jgi:hypothetical protein
MRQEVPTFRKVPTFFWNGRTGVGRQWPKSAECVSGIRIDMHGHSWTFEGQGVGCRKVQFWGLKRESQTLEDKRGREVK